MQRLIDHLLAAGRLKGDERRVALADHKPQLSAGEQKLVERLNEAHEQAGFQPPDMKALTDLAGGKAGALPDLLALGVAEGRLVRVDADLYLGRQWEHQLRQRLGEALRDGGRMTVSQIRELLGTSRKYAVPFCEYLDRIGFTRREGDVRVLGDADAT